MERLREDLRREVIMREDNSKQSADRTAKHLAFLRGYIFAGGLGDRQEKIRQDQIRQDKARRHKHKARQDKAATRHKHPEDNYKII